MRIFFSYVAWERNVAKLSPASIGILGSPVPILAGWPIKPLSLPPLEKCSCGSPRWRFIAFPSVSNDRFPYGCEIIFCNDFRRSAEKAAAADRFFFCASVCPPSSRARQPSMSFHRDPFSSSHGRETASRKFSVPPNHQIRQRAKKTHNKAIFQLLDARLNP